VHFIGFFTHLIDIIDFYLLHLSCRKPLLPNPITYKKMNLTKKIVLAEDNSILSKLLQFKLEKEGYHLLIAANGKEAVDLIEDNNPDMILTDIMMPFISGLEVISHVRNKLEMKTPIVVFSSAGQEEMVLNAFNLGATDFMSKPFSPNELIIRIKRLMQ
jgi:DNA-binding response OmpR family regulator